MAKRKTHEEFMVEFKNSNRDDIDIMEEYKTWDTKIKVKCKKCNYIWNLYPNHIIKKFTYCPECFKKRRYDEQAISDEEFIKKLSKRNPKVSLVGKYINKRTKTLFKCNDCNHIWNASPSNILNGHGCPICMKKKISKARTTPYDIFVEKSNLSSKHIIVNKEQYVNITTKIPCECGICGYKWKTLPSILINGGSCPKCSFRMKKTTEQFILELEHINPEVEVIGEYSNNQTKIKCKCRQNGHEFESIPSNLLSGQGCSKCNSSSGEKIIRYYLDKYNIDYIEQKTFDELFGVYGRKLSYDFYLPTYNTLIEFQGRQHYEPIKFFGGMSKFKIQKEHDIRKYNYAKDNDINLLLISYLDISNIKTIINNHLNKIN